MGSILEYLQAMPEYSLTDRAGQIQCPTLITQAENDPLAAFADQLYDALECPKELIQFTAAEGADNHCEMHARTLFHQRTFDWLDDVLSNE